MCTVSCHIRRGWKTSLWSRCFAFLLSWDVFLFLLENKRLCVSLCVRARARTCAHMGSSGLLCGNQRKLCLSWLSVSFYLVGPKLGSSGWAASAFMRFFSLSHPLPLPPPLFSFSFFLTHLISLLFLVSFKTRSHCAAQADLELESLLPGPLFYLAFLKQVSDGAGMLRFPG